MVNKSEHEMTDRFCLKSVLHLTVMAWTGGSLFCIDYNGLDQRKVVLHLLEVLVLEEGSFASTRMAWTRGSRFFIDLDGLD